VPEFHPSIGDAIGYAMAHNIRLAREGASGPDSPSTARFVGPAAALRDLADQLTEEAAPAEAARIVQQILDPETGVLAALTDLTAAATDWARARLTFDNPHRNPGFELWKRLNGCTSMLAEIGLDLRTAPSEIAASPQAPVDSTHHDFIRRRRDNTSGSRAASGSDGLSVLSTPGAMESYSDFQDAEANRQRAARSASPNATARNSGASDHGPAQPAPARPDRAQRSR
jgi:hypothetical protein